MINYNKKRISKWDNYDNCFSAAKNCSNKSNFIKKYYNAYLYAKKNSWLNDYTWFIGRKIKWTEEACYNAAKECTTLKEFASKYKSACIKSHKCGWIQDLYMVEENDS